jgi:hypothetical protein
MKSAAAPRRFGGAAPILARPHRGPLAVAALCLGLAPPEIVDRVVAVVDKEAITLSEAEEAQRLYALKHEGATPTLAEVTEKLIEARLLLRELSRYPVEPVTSEDVQAALESVRSSYAVPAEFERALVEAGMTVEQLTSDLRQQLALTRYLERRFRILVHATDADVERYYREELLPETRSKGEPDPSLGGIAEAIRRILEERRFNERVGEWIEQLKSKSSIRRHVW